jgi:hypothetical protein
MDIPFGYANMISHCALATAIGLPALSSPMALPSDVAAAIEAEAAAC